MADISSFLKKILEAIYGEEVRGSIHDALAAMNMYPLQKLHRHNQRKRDRPSGRASVK